MSEKLKTLDDFECGCVSCGQCMSEHKPPFEVNAEELRGSAIEWIIELEKRNETTVCGDPFGSYDEHHNCSDFQNVINWIKHRYNLTDKDIKKRRMYNDLSR